MAMTIELDRRFVEFREDEQSNADLVARFGLTDGTLGWPDILARRRVVFLAEAGSGNKANQNARSDD